MITFKETCPEYAIKSIKHPDIPKAKIKSSKEAYEYALQFYDQDLAIYESMFMILMNRANNTIGWVKISQGGVSGTVCDNKIVAFYASKVMASGVILVHNHPSGELKPSHADEELTKKIKSALLLLDIALLDHIIVSTEGFFSFADEGLII